MSHIDVRYVIKLPRTLGMSNADLPGAADHRLRTAILEHNCTQLVLIPQAEM